MKTLTGAQVDRIHALCQQIEAKIIAYRRDFHRHAESGWTEFRTASLVARRLNELGYQVTLGPAVIIAEERMGLPPDNELEFHWHRAQKQGGDPEFLKPLRGGFTGVVGTLKNGPGPTIGLRFDMDALELLESTSPDHRPVREGFASINEGAMHACGHDGHTAIGLGVAEVLINLRENLRGTVKLIFQPAEEGVRGAKSMVAAGVVDDVDFMLGHHLFSGWPVGEIECGLSGYLATTKFDAFFTGEPAHAGGSPQAGKNALLAASTAVLNLYAIPRHRDGVTRINVGRLTAGTGRNIISPNAHLLIETRGDTTALNEYMYQNAVRILQAAATMHQCKLRLKRMGEAQSASSNPELAQQVKAVSESLGGFTCHPPQSGRGSEDYTYMMQRVQDLGGQATNIGVGADLGGWGHHTTLFDVDERAFKKAMALFVGTTLSLMG